MRTSKYMAALGAVGLVVLGLGGACISDLPECPFHCWESSVANADLPEDSERPGYFTMQCTDKNEVAVFVPIPDLGFGARACFSGSTGPTDYPGPALNFEKHFFMKLAVFNLAAGQGLTPDQQDAYETWVEALRQAVVDSCVQALTCNGNPGTCDIDSNTPLTNESCNIPSATSLCEILVATELESQLALPNPEKYPECSGTDMLPVFAEDEENLCEGFVPDMTGGQCEDFEPGMGESGSEAGGADDESGADTTGGSEDTAGADEDGGADTTGTDGDSGSTGAGAAPFGDVPTLVDCLGNDCTVDAELVDNVYANFDVFYDEGVRLELVDASVTCGPGIRISGLGSGSASADLARPFGVDAGDVITRLNGMPIVDADDILAALDMISAETQFTVHLRERAGSTCRTRALTLEVK